MPLTNDPAPRPVVPRPMDTRGCRPIPQHRRAAQRCVSFCGDYRARTLHSIDACNAGVQAAVEFEPARDGCGNRSVCADKGTRQHVVHREPGRCRAAGSQTQDALDLVHALGSDCAEHALPVPAPRPVVIAFGARRRQQPDFARQSGSGGKSGPDKGITIVCEAAAGLEHALRRVSNPIEPGCPFTCVHSRLPG